MLAFDSDLAPVVGQQVTLNATNSADVGGRINLLIERARTPFVSKELGGSSRECDLVARMVESGALRGYLFDPVAGNFAGADGTRRSDAELRALAAVEGQEVTYTWVPPGSGKRVGYNASIVVNDAVLAAPGSGVGSGDGSGSDSEAGGSSAA